MSDNSDYERRFARLQASYLERVEGRIARLEELRDACREGGDAEDFDEIYQIVHRMSGTGETMGFPKIGEASIAVEERLDRAEGALRDDPALLGEVLEGYCTRLRGLLDEL